MSEPLTEAQKEALADWFGQCEERTESGALPSVWLDELEAVVAKMLEEDRKTR